MSETPLPQQFYSEAELETIRQEQKRLNREVREAWKRRKGLPETLQDAHAREGEATAGRIAPCRTADPKHRAG
jgi:septal ring factor EnvC (AmiA/AmiB activator)